MIYNINTVFKSKWLNCMVGYIIRITTTLINKIMNIYHDFNLVKYIFGKKINFTLTKISVRFVQGLDMNQMEKQFWWKDKITLEMLTLYNNDSYSLLRKWCCFRYTTTTYTYRCPITCATIAVHDGTSWPLPNEIPVVYLNILLTWFSPLQCTTSTASGEPIDYRSIFL